MTVAHTHDCASPCIRQRQASRCARTAFGDAQQEARQVELPHVPHRRCDATSAPSAQTLSVEGLSKGGHDCQALHILLKSHAYVLRVLAGRRPEVEVTQGGRARRVLSFMHYVSNAGISRGAPVAAPTLPHRQMMTASRLGAPMYRMTIFAGSCMWRARLGHAGAHA